MLISTMFFFLQPSLIEDRASGKKDIRLFYGVSCLRKSGLRVVLQKAVKNACFDAIVSDISSSKILADNQCHFVVKNNRKRLKT